MAGNRHASRPCKFKRGLFRIGTFARDQRLLYSFECLERDQQAKAETGSAGQTASFVQRSRYEVSIWRMICRPAWFHTAPAHLPKIGFKSGKIAERYRWACARTPRSRPEWASIGIIASTPAWR